MRNSDIYVNSKAIYSHNVLEVKEQQENENLLEIIESNLEYVLNILERNSKQDDICFNKRETLLQVWVLKKIIEKADLNESLNNRIDLLYRNLDKEVFSI